mgnify:CR=1 FL=1
MCIRDRGAIEALGVLESVGATARRLSAEAFGVLSAAGRLPFAVGVVGAAAAPLPAAVGTRIGDPAIALLAPGVVDEQAAAFAFALPAPASRVPSAAAPAPPIVSGGDVGDQPVAMRVSSTKR